MPFVAGQGKAEFHSTVSQTLNLQRLGQPIAFDNLIRCRLQAGDTAE